MSFIINLKQPSSTQDRKTIQSENDIYLLEADKRYNLKKLDKQMSFNNAEEKVLMIDLQKCLPCLTDDNVLLIPFSSKTSHKTNQTQNSAAWSHPHEGG